MLMLSAAFNTIDHSILLNRLHKHYGITGTALSWFETYLTDHCQIIQLNGESSDEMRLQFGVPQGSVFGPLLFTSDTAPRGEIARRHGVELHLHADDTQVYMSFSPLSDGSTTRTFQRIEACIAEIRTWLKNNKLMLNDDKKDVLVISSVSMFVFRMYANCLVFFKFTINCKKDYYIYMLVAVFTVSSAWY